MGRGCRGGGEGETTLTEHIALLIILYIISQLQPPTRRARNDRCCVPLHNDSMASLLSLLRTHQFPRMPRNYSVYSFAVIGCLRNSTWRPTQEHVASCGGNVALGNFVRLAEATVCCPGVGDASQGSKGQRGRSKIQIEA
jgi:hypothetical protein